MAEDAMDARSTRSPTGPELNSPQSSLNSSFYLVIDRAARLAADLCGAPLALIRLTDGEPRWASSSTEWTGATVAASVMEFWATACRADRLIERPDVSPDPALDSTRHETPSIRFMAGVPIVMPNGQRAGALCIFDQLPRRLDGTQRKALAGIGDMVAAALAAREGQVTSAATTAVGAAVPEDDWARALYESTPAMLHSIDPTGRLVNVSDAWLSTLGYERHEVEGRPSVEFLTPESQQRARDEVLPAFFASGRCNDVPYQMVRKDGSLIDVLLSAVLERDHDGRPLRSLAVMQDVTERRLTAARLQESRHMLQLVLDSLPVRISYWDAASRNQFGNRAFLQGFGVTQSAITGKHAREVLGADWYERIRVPIEQGLAGQAGQVEVSSLGPEAVRRDVQMLFTPDLRDGNVHGLFVLAMDVSARREAERRLADRERRFKLLIDGVHDYAIYMLDAQGGIATWNAGAERTQGYRAGNVVGQHFRLLFTPEDIAAGTPEHVLSEAAIQGRFEAEDWRVRADGRRFWASSLLSAIRDDRGELIGYAVVTRDLTELKRQQLMLDRTVEAAPCAMLMVDAAGKILMVNAQTERTFGYARNDLVGQPLEKLIPARWREQHGRLREGFMANAAVRAMGVGRELRALRSDGEEFPVEIGLSPIEMAGGTATLAAITDITERRRQQALIERALAEKEILLKEVYHRVKNNLQVVQSLLSLQSQTLQDGPAREAVDDSAQRVRAMALVHEKLYQSGNLSAVSLRGYVRDLVDQIAEALRVDQLKVRIHLDVADVQTGLDNAVPFGLLLTELITNCLKHAFRGSDGGDIRVSLVRLDDGDHLCVSDSGVGLPPGFGSPALSTSMGLQVADGLTRQLGGQLHARTDGGAVLSARLARL